MTDQATIVSFIAMTPGGARRFVRSSLRPCPVEQCTADAELLVSELVTMALCQGHAHHAAVSVLCRPDGAHVDVSVPSVRADNGSSTKPEEPSWTSLGILDAVAKSWGVSEGTYGSGIWFDVAA